MSEANHKSIISQKVMNNHTYFCLVCVTKQKFVTFFDGNDNLSIEKSIFYD